MELENLRKIWHTAKQLERELTQLEDECYTANVLQPGELASARRTLLDIQVKASADIRRLEYEEASLRG